MLMVGEAVTEEMWTVSSAGYPFLLARGTLRLTSYLYTSVWSWEMKTKTTKANSYLVNTVNPSWNQTYCCVQGWSWAINLTELTVSEL